MRTDEQAEGKEGIGVIVAIVVLLVAFGSVIAAGIPIGTALFGIFIGLSIIGILAGLTEVPSISPLLATMIGLGVGIDYALFIVTRHRSFLQEGRSVVDSVGSANATAGSAVTVRRHHRRHRHRRPEHRRHPGHRDHGPGVGDHRAVAVVAAVTLLPALLGLAGRRIDSWHVGRRHAVAVELAQRPSPAVGPTTSAATRGATPSSSLVGLVALAAPASPCGPACPTTAPRRPARPIAGLRPAGRRASVRGFNAPLDGRRRRHRRRRRRRLRCAGASRPTDDSSS